MNQSSHTEKLLPVITGFFVAVLIISNILAVKIVQLGFFVFDGGTILFPLSYIFGDVLTEVYGYKTARKAIWTGLAALVLTSVSIWCVGLLPAQADWKMQVAFDSILAPLPRIVLASICGYFLGEYSNSVVLSRLKIVTQGRFLWTRTVGSTLVGEAIDSAIFVTIAFVGLYPTQVLIAMALSNYVFKCAVEIAFTPLTYYAVRKIKATEQRDQYDYGERYNPLPIGRSKSTNVV